jgi:uncharacterized protein YggT (Ycf19 family)
MGIIDFLLSAAGLLLWLNWRAIHFDTLVRNSAASLAGTLRRAEPRRLRRWHLFAALVALLLLRPMLYAQVGPAVGWTPSVRFGVIAVPFRSDLPGRMMLFSLFSFSVMLAALYLWLLFLSLVNYRGLEEDPVQKLVRLHLGRVQRLPWPVRLLLPLVLGTLLWLAASELLAWSNILPAPRSPALRVQQAVLIALGSYLSWKYLIGALLALHLLTSYIYLGNQPIWNYITVTGQNLLRPLQRLSLRAGKIDFTPIAGLVLVFITAEFAERGLSWLFQRLLA